MNKEDFGAVKNLYESIITEAPLRDEPLWDGPDSKIPVPKPGTTARPRATTPVTTPARPGTTATAPATTPAKPGTTATTPARPSSSATASTADKIKGGMEVYNKQRAAGDMKGTAETGMAVNKLKYGDNFAKPKTPNPLMQKTFGYQTGNSPKEQQARADKIVQSGAVAALKPQAPTPTVNPTPSTSPIKKPGSVMASFEWGSKATLKDVANAYNAVYEGKKKDQDQDGDNDFADVRIARMIASGMSKAEAIAAVKNKEYNEEFELDEATRMRKELGKEGETATRKELAARSRAYKRSGSVDRTIAAAERAADWSGDEKKAKTLRGLASSRRGSVRDKPRAGMKGYAAKVEGDDKDLQSARQKAMSAGTLTPKEKKQLGEIYEIVASYLLENNFAATVNDANAIIENMSEVWLTQILESAE